LINEVSSPDFSPDLRKTRGLKMARIARHFLVILALAAMAVIPMASQVQKPMFEVASIKPTTVRGPIDDPSGRFIAVGQPLKALIGYAYRVRDYQIIGGPSWINYDLWQIQAKAEEGTVGVRRSRTFADAMKVDTVALMVQSLLEDRFQLKLHHEMREIPGYELIVAKGGPKIRLADDQSPLPNEGAPAPSFLNGLPPLTRGTSRIGGGPNGMHYEAKAILLDPFINILINVTRRTVVDKTGLTGLYDMKMDWVPDTLDVPAGATAAGPPVASPPSGPSLTTAIQEQLGLRLVSTRVPADILIIDSVQRPSEN
jgi:uncharacterized protein (TIGR03435 family)